MDLSGNQNIQYKEKELWKVILHCQVKNINLSNTDVGAIAMQQFKSILMGYQVCIFPFYKMKECTTSSYYYNTTLQVPPKINVLNLSGNHNIECQELWEVVLACQIKELDLSNTRITQEGLEKCEQMLLEYNHEVCLLRHICSLPSGYFLAKKVRERCVGSQEF